MEPNFKAPKMTAAEKAAARRHMRLVKELNCVICNRSGPSDAHHCFHGRYSTAKATDWQVIPLCRECHLTGPAAIHKQKATWAEHNGPDTDYLLIVQEQLEEMR